MKWKLIIFSCFLTLMFAVGCSSKAEKLKAKEVSAAKPTTENSTLKKPEPQPSTPEKPQKLTLEKVKELAKKGDNLSWKDFKSFEGKEVGSGLYIMAYPIDDKYAVTIGGGGLESKPKYIYLNYNNNAEKEKYIDIRHDDVEKFINSNK